MSAERGDLNLLLAATGAALATLAVVTAKQLGVIDHLPDPPGRIFDSDGITGSKAAHPLGVPDGVLGLASYGATLGLAFAARESGQARRLLGWKLALDGAAAGANVVRQVAKFGKVCSWCTGTALCTAAMVSLGRPTIAGSLRGMGAEVRR